MHLLAVCRILLHLWPKMKTKERKKIETVLKMLNENQIWRKSAQTAEI